MAAFYGTIAESMMKYKLVHITSGGEYKTPLVASQLFDQAECQASEGGEYAPMAVEAWILGAMREYWDASARARVNMLRARCPGISIHMFNGISRLGGLPLLPLMKLHRMGMGKRVPVIYHCRGEEAAFMAAKLREDFPGDKVVLDVRGHWPSEWLYARGIEYPERAEGTERQEYDKLRERLRYAVGVADGVTTVSNALRALLIKDAGATEDTIVVPCCVKQIPADSERDRIRKEWGVGVNERVIVYSGTTAAYQHLDDLTIPFMKALAQNDAAVRLAFLSPDVEKINAMLQRHGADMGRTIVKSLPQQEVAAALTACDIGVLIRKPTVVNSVANPVKIAEYLAAGLPLIIEKGVGGVAQQAFDAGIMFPVQTTVDATVIPAALPEWIRDTDNGRRQAVRKYVSDVYLWQSAIHVSRGLYRQISGNV